MKEFSVGEKVSANGMGVFTIINKHDKFSGWVDSKKPLMLIYDGDMRRQDAYRYITYSEYKELAYDLNEDISIISRGYFHSKIYLTEDKPRYDIRNTETDEIINGCYLHNGSWFSL